MYIYNNNIYYAPAIQQLEVNQSRTIKLYEQAESFEVTWIIRGKAVLQSTQITNSRGLLRTGGLIT